MHPRGSLLSSDSTQLSSVDYSAPEGVQGRRRRSGCWGLQPSDLWITRKADREAELLSCRPCSQIEPVTLWLSVSTVPVQGVQQLCEEEKESKARKHPAPMEGLVQGVQCLWVLGHQYRGPRSPVRDEKQSVHVYGSEERHSAPPSWHEKLGKDSQSQTAAGISTFLRSWSKCEPVNVSIPHIPYPQRKKKWEKSSLEQVICSPTWWTRWEKHHSWPVALIQALMAQ